ncbi:MAG TPA: serine hydrolase domain-containing protein [Gemmatimonadaceae bacterium]|jgi:CubicO group peptidase (beta-lactamase class C family)|nr:serine hydrolase domain-containing protein [Gemmatimonadaceae bacterium]
MHPKLLRLRCAAAGALTLSLLFSAATAAAGAQQTGVKVDSLARAFRAQHSTPALVVGVVNSTGERILPYGIAGDGSTPVTGDTRFEVGSVTKIFTSLLLARMVENGGVRLDDPIARYLPDSVQAPDYRGQQITLRELATHSSGLPRLPTNIAPANMSDPYAGYSAEKLYHFLDSYELPRAPDSTYEYSNLGAGLLGFLLSRHAGKPFAELLKERIFQPLGMSGSYVAELGESTDTRLAQGHAEGKPVPFWHFGSLEGAGAVRSSTRDLLRLIGAELHPERTSMAKAIELSQKIRFHASPQLALALGWHVVQLPDRSSLYWHNGGTGGARSFVGFVPEAGAGVVVLMNEALPLNAVTQFGVQVARAALVQ